MCGITGIVNLREPRPIEAAAVEEMIGAARHRGPDAAGIYLDDWVGLGHARLSIIDLEGGAQPIQNEDGTLWIVYNGEVFNYPELRADLEERGHRFRTSTDTEVIVHLYEEKGTDCLADLNGQFAFALWDSRKRELFLARDRVGIRPLHYAVHGDRLLFASEIKSIFAVDGVPRALDPEALNQVFTYWTPLPGKTPFSGVRELPPGHFMRVTDGRVDVQRYWDIPFCPPDEYEEWTEEGLAEAVRNVLTDATRIRLRADVPVGCYLSGGLDSSTIATLVSKRFNNNLCTFGITFEESEFDESVYQRRMVEHLGVDHRDLRATNAAIGEALPKMIWHAEKPLLRTGPIPLYLLSGLVRDSDYKVVLTGEGADEVFAGYNIFRETLMRKAWIDESDPKKREADLERLYPYVLKDAKLGSVLRAFFAKGLDRLDAPFFSHHIRWRNTGRIRGFLAPDVRAPADDDLGLDAVRRGLPESFGEWDSLSKAQYLEMSLFMSNYLLSSQGDRAAMAHSVEIRLPFLDYRLLELMGRARPNFKMRDATEKYILKKAFDSELPPEIVSRAKQPYRAPIRNSLLQTGTDYSRELLSDKALRASMLFDAPKVARLVAKLEKATAPSETDVMALAGVLTTQLLHQQYISDFPYERPTPVRAEPFVDRTSRGARNSPKREA